MNSRRRIREKWIYHVLKIDPDWVYIRHVGNQHCEISDFLLLSEIATEDYWDD